MKPLTYFFFVLLLVCLNLEARAQTFIKTHEAGPLEWIDFKGKIPADANETQASFYLGYRPELQKYNDSLVYRLKAVGYFDRGLSYADSNHRTTNRLRYHQVQFNLLELHRRYLQKELDLATKKSDFDALFRNVNATYLSLKAAFEREAQQIERGMVLLKWEQELDSLLRAVPRYTKPVSTFGPFHVALNYGVGYSFFDNRIEDRVEGGMNFQLGVQFGVNKVFTQVNMRTIMYDFNNGFEELGLRYSLLPSELYCDFLFGYKLLEKGRFQMAPLIGFSVISNTSQSPLMQDQYKFVFGLNADFSLFKDIYNYNAAFGERKVYGFRAIRTQLLISDYNFPDGTHSLLFSFSIGIKLGGGFIK